MPQKYRAARLSAFVGQMGVYITGFCECHVCSARPPSSAPLYWGQRHIARHPRSSAHVWSRVLLTQRSARASSQFAQLLPLPSKLQGPLAPGIQTEDLVAL